MIKSGFPLNQSVELLLHPWHKCCFFLDCHPPFMKQSHCRTFSLKLIFFACRRHDQLSRSCPNFPPKGESLFCSFLVGVLNAKSVENNDNTAFAAVHLAVIDPTSSHVTQTPSSRMPISAPTDLLPSDTQTVSNSAFHKSFFFFSLFIFYSIHMKANWHLIRQEQRLPCERERERGNERLA